MATELNQTLISSDFLIMVRHYRHCLSRLAVGLLISGISTLGLSHSGENHDDPGVNVTVDSTETENQFPIEFGGDFKLIDHDGYEVTKESYKGKHMLVFFGYASCKNMCSISLTRVGKALELLGDSVNQLIPLVITVDPDRDTPQVLQTELAKYHPSLVGLTGDSKQLEAVYTAYKQKPTEIDDDWEGDPVISHSSYIYLMNEEGEFQTLFPPILNPQSMADIMKKYIGQNSTS